jgi:hypothetical protein
VASAALYFGPGAAWSSSATSATLSTAGSRRGSRTIVSRRARSGRSSVTVKKKRRAATAPLMLGGCMPVCVWCSWKRRRSSAVAVSGERPMKAANARTLRMSSLRVFSVKPRTLMSSIMRARSALIGRCEGWEVIGSSSLKPKVAGPSMLGIGCPNRHALPLTGSLSPAKIY